MPHCKKWIVGLTAVLIAGGISGCGFPTPYRPAGDDGDDPCLGIEILLPRDSLQQGDTMTARLLIVHGEGDKSLCDDGLASWESDDGAVAAVDQSGIITGAGPGEAVLRARWSGFETERPITVTRAVDYGKILLNEVFYDDTGTDTGREFIEVCNRNEYECDLSGFTLVDGSPASSPFIFPNGSIIPALGTAIIAQSADGFSTRFGFIPHFAGFSFTLNNSGETMFLKLPDGSMRDSVYIEGGSTDFPAPPGWGSMDYPAAVEGWSIQRGPAPDSDGFDDWLEGAPSPGY